MDDSFGHITHVLESGLMMWHLLEKAFAVTGGLDLSEAVPYSKG